MLKSLAKIIHKSSLGILNDRPGIKKCHKVTSDIHHRRKFLRPKIWSHGTPLGYLGPASQKGQDRIFSKPHFLFILDLNEFPTPQKSFLFEKNLKSFAT